MSVSFSVFILHHRRGEKVGEGSFLWERFWWRCEDILDVRTAPKDFPGSALKRSQRAKRIDVGYNNASDDTARLPPYRFDRVFMSSAVSNIQIN